MLLSLRTVQPSAFCTAVESTDRLSWDQASSGVLRYEVCQYGRELICLGAPPSTGATNNCVEPGRIKPLPSMAYRMVVTAIGGGAHLAPAGFNGIGGFHSGVPSTNEKNASHLPSGDQARLDTPRSMFSRTRSRRESNSRIWMRDLPVRSDEYAIYLPSGDQCGLCSCSLPEFSVVMFPLLRILMLE